MQLSSPRPCPDCEDGHKGDKLCIVCRGSGHVSLVPAERPVPIGPSWLEARVNKPDKDVYA